jgi:hydrogenase expression/formation protein HypC
VKSIEGTTAQVEISGVTRPVSLRLTPQAKVGDYVIVHTGFAINVLDEKEGAETLRLFDEIAEVAKEEEEEAQG